MESQKLKTLEELKTYSRLGQALFSDPALSDEISRETLSVSSLHDVSDQETLDHAIRALLARAHREGSQIRPNLVNESFYRLSPDERFILTALHTTRWSYERVAQILDLELDGVEKFAWRTRLLLAGSQNPYPPGSHLRAIDCPEYFPMNPWTQRFMDEEMGHNERLFIQHHLMSCETCRRSLTRCREIYYSVEGRIPQVPSFIDERRVQTLEQSWTQTKKALRPSRTSLTESLRRFSRHRDIRIAASVLALLLGFWFLRSL